MSIDSASDNGSSTSKAVLVLGASGVLGSALSRELRQLGIPVYGTGFQKLPMHVDAALKLDLTRKDQIPELVKWLDAQPLKISGMVHAIGGSQDHLIGKISDENWRKTIDLNLKSAFLVTQALLPRFMKQKNGVLIYVGSWGGISGRGGQCHYASAKAALVGLTQSLAREYASRGIRVHHVIPGVFESPMTRGLTEDQLEKIWRGSALEGMTPVDDIAEFIVRLLQLRSASGQVYHLDGRIPSVLG